MKLVDPGPQPPPFEVEYSELEADKPRTEQEPEEDSSPVAKMVEAAVKSAAVESAAVESATEESAVDGRAADVADDNSTVEAKPQPVDALPPPTAKPAGDNSDEPGNDNAEGGDTFGAGLDVGDDAAEPQKDDLPANEQPTVETESVATTPSETKATDSESDSVQKKRGKRPNRRRRSRRGQKKDDGSSPKADS